MLVNTVKKSVHTLSALCTPACKGNGARILVRSTLAIYFGGTRFDSPSPQGGLNGVPKSPKLHRDLLSAVRDDEQQAQVPLRLSSLRLLHQGRKRRRLAA